MANIGNDFFRHLRNKKIKKDDIIIQKYQNNVYTTLNLKDELVSKVDVEKKNKKYKLKGEKTDKLELSPIEIRKKDNLIEIDKKDEVVVRAKLEEEVLKQLERDIKKNRKFELKVEDINEKNIKNELNKLIEKDKKEVNKINDEYFNKNKITREKPYVESQKTNEIIIRRNGITYDFNKNVFYYKLIFVVPLINNVSINGKSAFKAIKEIISLLSKKIESINKDELNKNIDIYLKQQEIRKFIKENNYVAFISNGSILPRKEGTNKPLEDAIKFISPKSLETLIKLNDGTEILGMGIKKGITVITGGGYSGKTTLLEAIEMGVYNHEYGDGREYCITDDSAMKICAEEGRYVTNTNISPFYKYIPSSEGIHNFSTQDASGSISQAVNIIEAINCESKLLLIDEDRSATNFMIRDYNMHLVVKNDPIIPFTNRIKEIYNDYDASTILVIGGSSVYLNYANCVILLEDYIPKDITSFVKTLDLMKVVEEPDKTNFISKRKIANFK